MHEVSLVANLFEILEKKVREKKAKKITMVKLQVGTLSGAVPEFLVSAFDVYKKDTIASEACLKIEEVPFKVRCLNCQQEMVKNDFVLICENCGSRQLKVLAGTELILEKIEMEV